MFDAAVSLSFIIFAFSFFLSPALLLSFSHATPYYFLIAFDFASSPVFRPLPAMLRCASYASRVPSARDFRC